MSSTERLLDAAGHQRSPVTLPGYHQGRPPKNKVRHFPADPPPVEKLNLMAEMTAVHVPASPGDGISDMIAKTARGDTDYAMSPISIAAPLLQDGRLVALGVTSARRSPTLPEVPSIAEAGMRSTQVSPRWSSRACSSPNSPVPHAGSR